MRAPKRHHYVPRLILNGFTDPEGWLHWCRHREDPATVRPARPAELFHQNHLYSTVSETGAKDPRLERALASLESDAASVVQDILSYARTGRVPDLTREQMRTWNLFFLMQWRRTPETQKSSTSDAEVLRMLDDILDELRVSAPHRMAEIEALATPQAKARTLRNVRADVVDRFSEEMLQILENRGIAVLRIAQQNKSFIIGSRPVVKMTSPGRSDLRDPIVEMWMPIASDVAVGVGDGDGRISLRHVVDSVPVRLFNRAIAAQSGVVAAGSAALVRSIANPR